MFKKTFLASFLFCMGATGFTSSGVRSPVDRFSFEYAVSGDARARPLQVFDDGRKTYLQYRPNQDIPAFISSVSGELMMPSQEGPYTVLNGTPRDFVASMGTATARITHATALSNAPQYTSRLNQQAVPIERGQPYELVASAQNVAQMIPRYEQRNDWSSNSYATPSRGDQVAWANTSSESSKVVLFERGTAKLSRDAELRARKMASEAVGATRVVITASDDAKPGDVGGTERAKVIRNYLISAGIDQAVITTKVGFVFDEQLQKVGKKLFNPTTVTWYMPGTPARDRQVARNANSPDESMAVISQLRAGKITPSQAVQMLQASTSTNTGSQLSAQGVVAKPTMPTSWSVRKEDQTVEKMLGRWAADAGWRLVWKNAPLVQITADSDRPISRPDFVQAADYVITQAKAAGYKISATAYANQVLVVTPD